VPEAIFKFFRKQEFFEKVATIWQPMGRFRDETHTSSSDHV